MYSHWRNQIIAKWLAANIYKRLKVSQIVASTGVNPHNGSPPSCPCLASHCRQKHQHQNGFQITKLKKCWLWANRNFLAGGSEARSHWQLFADPSSLPLDHPHLRWLSVLFIAIMSAAPSSFCRKDPLLTRTITTAPKEYGKQTIRIVALPILF